MELHAAQPGLGKGRHCFGELFVRCLYTASPKASAKAWLNLQTALGQLLPGELLWLGLLLGLLHGLLLLLQDHLNVGWAIHVWADTTCQSSMPSVEVHRASWRLQGELSTCLSEQMSTKKLHRRNVMPLIFTIGMILLQERGGAVPCGSDLVTGPPGS